MCAQDSINPEKVGPIQPWYSVYSITTENVWRDTEVYTMCQNTNMNSDNQAPKSESSGGQLPPRPPQHPAVGGSSEDDNHTGDDHSIKLPVIPAYPVTFCGPGSETLSAKSECLTNAGIISSILQRIRRDLRRYLTFISSALLILPVGCIIIHSIWSGMFHRYECPETGYYRGWINAHFHSIEEPLYNLHFHSETSSRWYWRQPTHFCYTNLDVNWWLESSNCHAIVNLPGFTYTMDGTSGSFTREKLAEWLTDASTGQSLDKDHIDKIFGFFQAAANGSLPQPRHHTYYSDQPMHVKIQHFQLGWGVYFPVYGWLILWMLWVGAVCRKIWLAGSRE